MILLALGLEVSKPIYADASTHKEEVIQSPTTEPLSPLWSIPLTPFPF